MVELRIFVDKDFSGRWRVSIFGGQGLNRNGNLLLNNSLSKSFKLKGDADNYKNSLLKRFPQD